MRTKAEDINSYETAVKAVEQPPFQPRRAFDEFKEIVQKSSKLS